MSREIIPISKMDAGFFRVGIKICLEFFILVFMFGQYSDNHKKGYGNKKGKKERGEEYFAVSLLFMDFSKDLCLKAVF